MPDTTKATTTKDHVLVTTSKEVKIRAAKLEVPKIELYDLLTKLPFPELEVLAKKYLTSKKRPTSR